MPAGCATSPLGRSQLNPVSDDPMAQVCAPSFRQNQQPTPATQNGVQSHYLTCVADAIMTAIPDNGTPWEVKVFDSRKVHAFSRPGDIPVFQQARAGGGSRHCG